MSDNVFALTPETTEQQVFDYVARALIQQRCQSNLVDTVLCRYRGPKGTKCAVGHLISDAEYDTAMESGTVRGGNVARMLPNFPHIALAKWVGTDTRRLRLVGSMQTAHDSPVPTANWLIRFCDYMRDVARDFGLDASVVAV